MFYKIFMAEIRSPLLGVCIWIRVVSQPFCVHQLNPAGLILVRATLPIYLIKSPACSVTSLAQLSVKLASSKNNEDQKLNTLIFIRFS